ncbi:hypothetical protein [Mesorhizobium sp. B2-3-13]|uniref:hypothetical protein n=1 Tax=Mesorhizobium sp. B2-3-13 TaxID=2589951 RepID=UPI0015E3F2F3|nr:hypothetical protein [Mesorhizobium sp. B2-3-13]
MRRDKWSRAKPGATLIMLIVLVLAHRLEPKAGIAKEADKKPAPAPTGRFRE